MTDGYDLFCAMKLLEYSKSQDQEPQADDVTCACAKYLQTEGYESTPNQSLNVSRAALAHNVIPTTSNTTIIGE